MKLSRPLWFFLMVMLLLSLVPLAALAATDVTITLTEGEAIYFYWENDTLYVRSGENAGQACSGTVTLVGNDVTIPKIYADRDVGIKNVTISGSGITIQEGITASEGWGSPGWATGNTGAAVENLTITADNVTIHGGINGGKGGDAYHPGAGGAVTGLTLAGSNITVNDGINGGKGGDAYHPGAGGAVTGLTLAGSNITVNDGINAGQGGESSIADPGGNGGSVSNVTISGDNVVINGGIHGGAAGFSDNANTGTAGSVSGIQAVPQEDLTMLVITGADSASAAQAAALDQASDISSLIAGKSYVKLVHAEPLAAPEAVFTATGENTGTLTNVAEGISYSLDGSTWTAITGTSVDLTGLQGGTVITLYRPGNGTTTLDSAGQAIALTQAAKPENAAASACTTAAQNDGKLTGVDSTMEYKLSTASDWTAITAETVTGLANGTYEVRIAPSGTVLASPSAAVTVNAHTCVAEGDWQHDETSHYKLCACGAKLEQASHTYGEWAVTKEATAAEKGEKQRVCSVCGYTDKEELPLLILADPSNPPTGDPGILLPCLLLLLSGVGLAALSVPGKKHIR